jgi:hypothetical protein
VFRRLILLVLVPRLHISCTYFNFICWIKPDSPVINQLFGASSGMGLLPLTFDCACTAYIKIIKLRVPI